MVEDSSMSASLLERIQIHKEKDAMSASLMERIQYHKQNEQSGEGGSLTQLVILLVRDHAVQR
jgi:hypothetical protein